MNINDYLIWRGDIPICDKYPFNEVDSLILSRFSYLPFERIDFHDGDTIEEISNKMKSVTLFKLPGDENLIHYLGKSIRFKDFKVSDLKFIKSKESEKQFGAVTIHLKNKIYISFIGTDNSLVGWKEDFNLSFLKHIPAQTEGVKYLNDVARKYNVDIQIGGHSKGGNVAIYSSLYCEDKVREKISFVHSFDGPGFDKEIIDGGSVINNIKTYIPQDSVIGRLLNQIGEVITVQSDNKGLYEHDVYSWEIIKDRFVKLEGATETSDFTKDTINEWLLNTSPNNRKIFVDSIFDLLYSSNSESLKELSKTWTKNLPNMMNTYKELSKEDKKIISSMIIEFIKSSSSVFKITSKNKIEEIIKGE